VKAEVPSNQISKVHIIDVHVVQHAYMLRISTFPRAANVIELCDALFHKALEFPGVTSISKGPDHNPGLRASCLATRSEREYRGDRRGVVNLLKRSISRHFVRTSGIMTSFVEDSLWPHH
jgi:hypothetical protein